MSLLTVAGAVAFTLIAATPGRTTAASSTGSTAFG